MAIWASFQRKSYTLMGLISSLMISPIALADSLSEKEALLLVKHFDGVCVKNSENLDRIPILIEDIGGKKVPDDIAAKLDPDIFKQNGKTYYLEIEELNYIIIAYNDHACSIVYKNITPGDVNWAINKLYNVADQIIEKDGAQNISTFIFNGTPSVGPGYIFHKYDVIEDKKMYGVLSFALESEVNKTLVDSSNNKCGLPNSLVEQTKKKMCMVSGQYTPDDEAGCLKNSLSLNTKTQKLHLLYLNSCGHPELAVEYKSLLLEYNKGIQMLLDCMRININYIQLWNSTFLDMKGSLPCNKLDSAVILKQISDDMELAKRENRAFKEIADQFRIKQ